MNIRAYGRPLLSPLSNPKKVRHRFVSRDNLEPSTSGIIEPETENRFPPIQTLEDKLVKNLEETADLFRTGEDSDEEVKVQTPVPGSIIIPQTNINLNLRPKGRRMGDEQPRDPNTRPYGERIRDIPNNRRTAIRSPAISIDFSLKGNHLKSVEEDKFDGIRRTDPYAHLERFEKICRLYQYGTGQAEVVKLKLFPLTLIGDAATWFKELLDNSFTTWAELREGFIDEFYSLRTQRQLKNKIRGFTQDSGEDVVDAWKRFKEMLRNCPGHSMGTEESFEIFYDGLDKKTKRELGYAFGGSLNNISPNEGYKILEDMDKEYSTKYEDRDKRSSKNTSRSTVAKVESSEESKLVADVKALSKQMNERFDNQESRFKNLERDVKVMADGCDYCGNLHYSEDCPDKLSHPVVAEVQG